MAAMQNVWTLKVQKWLIWIACLATLILLRHLFPVIFLTFVLTYIANTIVKAMSRRFPRRRVNVVVVFAVFLLLLAGVGLLIVPKMFSEARQLAVFSISRDAANVEPREGETAIDRQTRRYVDSILIRLVGPATFRSFEQSETYEGLLQRVEDSIRAFLPKVTAGVRAFVNASIAIFFQFLLSIVLSF